MDYTMLEGLGLSERESRVYISLLELGKSQIGNIIEKSGVVSSKIYYVLDSLIEKGLVSFVLEGKIKQYSAVPPKRLHEFVEKEIQEKEDKLKIALEKLQKIKPKKKDYSAEIISGPRGVRAFWDMAIEKENSIIYVIGYFRDELEMPFWERWHKKRIEKKIEVRSLVNYDIWERWDKGKKRPMMERRPLPKGYEIPLILFVFGDTVGNVIITQDQRLVFMIKSEYVAENYKKFFDILWKEAGKRVKKSVRH